MYKREVERKFVVSGGLGLERACRLLTGVCGLPTLEGSHVDQFWTLPGVDFVRLRENSRELTVKVTDRGTIVDRIEENVVVEAESFTAAERLVTLLAGPPVGSLRKLFYVFKCPGYEVSLYKVAEDLQERVFLEVESCSLDVVDSAVNFLQEFLPSQLVPETRSLFQVFFYNPIPQTLAKEGVK